MHVQIRYIKNICCLWMVLVHESSSKGIHPKVFRLIRPRDNIDKLKEKRKKSSLKHHLSLTISPKGLFFFFFLFFSF